ncbi:MAG: UDP-4-amino-4,6-dideoxy-N-acetyl-beta-L-altrosamine transaminase [Armatimonadetes bacterium CG2_30_59_28]|nr:UDP-4-amino-4,6-dideoxy-N-acetyl-beta-L-altrosamine transaminase [Armatimonadota bacterium]OIO90067.1 MAG: UDP-4-amino-4,6-dideoxy-N-acetyl-beta-L-altrosamine transaminase [Armatimonadetes bacterium CG2_30_59_28]PIU60530.1 MAG: UDP-4-amino-4,6-dideoxy-N-acetyl-beta-L-altrosamine transaminase [Armatimonadetes bacterium CG07_land_8_20_14_0_80_59_28]PIX43235.1 MAG: UDP-4-amino-4,6-dideoxy-N-acetyl-beta-L-altrosamine transaminase [Armatimonadetes bacterium CG_4_8_14_3_um_filter_58_9]PIY43142.1 M
MAEQNTSENPSPLPYGRQCIDEDDIDAVVAALRSAWLTTGPKVPEFEQRFAEFVDADHAVAVCNGTAALHCAMYAIGIGAGGEVIIPAITFAATANCVAFQGGTPVVADVDEHTLLLDAEDVASRVTEKTKAIIAVDYAGQPCDYDALSAISQKHNLRLVADACHALGGSYRGRPVGSLADISTFSLHPVKAITTGEGGVVATSNPKFASRARTFRNHGITTDHRQREQQGSWFYEMVDLGYNYRITDFQCALGLSQLRKLPQWVRRRQAIAARYNEAFASVPEVEPLVVAPEVSHAYHLYVVQLDLSRVTADRQTIFAELRNKGIGVNVHYIPVHLHPYYQERYGTRPGQCPVAEAAYERIITLPLFPAMQDGDVDRVVTTVGEILNRHRTH